MPEKMNRVPVGDFAIFSALATLREFHTDHYAEMGGIGGLVKLCQMEAKILDALHDEPGVF